MPASINLERLESISFGDAAFSAELVAVFLDDSPEQVRRLAEAVARTDAREVTSAAHRLKGAAANLGADRLAELCRELEAIGREGRAAEFAGRLGVIEDVFDQVRRELEELPTAG